MCFSPLELLLFSKIGFFWQLFKFCLSRPFNWYLNSVPTVVMKLFNRFLIKMTGHWKQTFRQQL